MHGATRNFELYLCSVEVFGLGSIFHRLIYVQKEDTDLGDPKAIIRALLSFQGTQAEMIQQSTWMEMIIGSFELWERVVIYGQFQPIDAGETDQERRKRRNNTFAKQPTEYIQEIGSKGQLLRIIRHRIKE